MLFLSTLWWLPIVHAAVLTNFQVTQPVLVPTGVKECTVEVLRRDFAFSYGISEVVELEPPTDCGPVGSWSAITLNFTVTSNGTQYDRLGIFTFQNVEIWRTSTPEPTRGDGIIWTYIKDVTQYIPLFETPGTFILQLDNIIQEGLDGVYSTVLSATYYEATDLYPPAPRADHIIPLSTMRNDTGNDASVPPGFSINVTLPANAIKIYAELFASGNSQEEFWYYNVPNEFIPALPENTAYPQGPFREVRLLIDGQLAGVAFPYAVLFTGGIIPSFWRPISAYGALDLPTYFIDVTPFAPLLTDGFPHEFVIDVSSAESDHAINQNWYISGLLQIITDTSPEPTTGGITAYDVEPFAISTSSGETLNGGDDVEITVKSTRQIHIESTVISGSGEVTNVVWSQQLSYSNVQTYLNNALTQLARQTSEGIIVSTHNGEPVVADTFSYPLDIDIQYENMEATSWTASLNHTYDRTVQPNPLVLGTTIHNDQRVDGFFQRRTGGNIGNGSSSNVFSYVDTVGNTYARKVNAALNVITLDEESGSMANKMAKESLQRLQVVGLSEGDDSSEVRLPGQSL